MTGTPYQNRAQDLATQVTFIDPALKAATDKWWVNELTVGSNSTDSDSKPSAKNHVTKFLSEYMVRREKDVLGDRLPPKVTVTNSVTCEPIELSLYEHFEDIVLNILDQFGRLVDNNDPGTVLKRKQLFERMLSMASCMRMSLIHPLLPGGRLWTVQFSPTRHHLASSMPRATHCVCCSQGKKKSVSVQHIDLDEDMDDDDFDNSESFDIEETNEVVDKGKLVPLDANLCTLHAYTGFACHFVHEECMKSLVLRECPLCKFPRSVEFLSSLSHLFRFQTIGAIASLWSFWGH